MYYLCHICFDLMSDLDTFPFFCLSFFTVLPFQRMMIYQLRYAKRDGLVFPY